MEKRGFCYLLLFFLICIFLVHNVTAACVNGASCAGYVLGRQCCVTSDTMLTCTQPGGTGTPRYWMNPSTCADVLCWNAICNPGNPGYCSWSLMNFGSIYPSCTGTTGCGSGSGACHCDGAANCVGYCTDSDGGRNWFQQGITDPTPGDPVTDYCSGGNLYEYSCISSGAYLESHNCGTNYFCSAGACVYCAGCNSGGTCYAGNTVSQCGSGGSSCVACGSDQYCSSGACVPKCSCSDSDGAGDAFWTRGTVTIRDLSTGGTSTYTDDCLGSCSELPREWGCASATSCSPTMSGYTCGYGCTNGACNSVCKSLGQSCACRFECCGGAACYGGVCCVASCVGKVCGSDGCGGSCGSCNADKVCDASGQCVCNTGLSDYCGTSTSATRCYSSYQSQGCGDSDGLGCNEWCCLTSCPSGVCCNTGCCSSGQVCYNNACCTPNCAGKCGGTLSCGVACNGVCDDGNACTNNVCSSGACTYPLYCSGADTSCGCTSPCANCNLQDGWYDTSPLVTQWVSSGYCTEKQQKQQVSRDYYCSAGSCVFTSGAAQWVDTGSTRNKVDSAVCINDGSSCTNDYCSAGACVHPAYCSGASSSCGCASCVNCDVSGAGGGRTGDGCVGTSYVDYSCSVTSCVYTSTPYDSRCCTPSCVGKCGGASDGCVGTCTAACPSGQVCSSGSCVPCSGCISGGTCYAGNTNLQCGSGGSNCIACYTGSNCNGNTCVPYYITVSGSVTTSGGAGISGVTISALEAPASGDTIFGPLEAASATTNGAGAYSFSWWTPTYEQYISITPSKAGCTFSPIERRPHYTGVNIPNQNFVGTCCIPSCVGRCGGASDGCVGTCNGVCDDGNACTNNVCSSGACTYPLYCSGGDKSCGCASCIDCDTSGAGAGRTGDGCAGAKYIDYYCSGTSCAYTSTDVDSSSGYCSACGLAWNIGGEVAATSCCGDDSGENYRTFVDYAGSSYGVVDWGSSQDGCCDVSNDQINYNGNCVTRNDGAAGAVDTGYSGHDKYAAPYSGGWLECDGHPSWVTYYCSNVCSGGWVLYGDAAGESCGTAGGSGCYDAGQAGYGCCGDDSGENYRTFVDYAGSSYGVVDWGASQVSCCDAADQVNYNSACVTSNDGAAGAVSTGYSGHDKFAAPYSGGWLECDGHPSWVTYYCSNVCSGGWVLYGDAAGESCGTAGGSGCYDAGQAGYGCCGDDSGEFIGTESSPWGGIWHTPFTDGTNACCNDDNDISKDGVCYYCPGTSYQSGINPGGVDNYVGCHPEGWWDLDGGSSYCSYFSAQGLAWTPAGEAGVGEYGSSANGGDGTTECCGDDSGEFYEAADVGTQNVCCNTATDCAINGVCVSSGAADSGNSYCCYSSSLADGTKEVCADYSSAATCYYGAVNVCNGGVGWQCSYASKVCSAAAECSASNICGSERCIFANSGAYDWIATIPAETACTDMHDNDCDSYCDYDSRYCSHGDSDCPVSVTSIVVSNPAPIVGSAVTVDCGVGAANMAGVNSISVQVVGVGACSYIGWAGTSARFSCGVGSTIGSRTVKCYVDRTKSYQSGTNQSVAINVLPTTCSGYTTSAPCDADSRCDWCPECVSAKYTGDINRCVAAGGCPVSYCWTGKCGNTCDPTNYLCNNLDACSGACPGCSYYDYYCNAACGCVYAAYDPDLSSLYCGGCARNFVAGGEAAAFGQYDSGTATECCGDDSGEFYEAADVGTQNVCCNTATDCAINSLCVASGSADTTNNYCCYGNSVATGTKQLCSTYSSGTTCFSSGVNTCNGLSGWTCSYSTTTCSSTNECTGTCSSQKCIFTNQGAYAWISPVTAETSCSDGHDNNCNGERDYDGKDYNGNYVSKGDASCPVAVTSVTSPSSACPASHFTVKCGSSVANVRSVSAYVGSNLCSFVSWDSSNAVFDCVASGTVGSYVVKCTVDTTKSYQSGTDKTATLAVGGTSCCSAYGNPATCAADTSCEWCVSCDASNHYSGSASPVCVVKGSCIYSCWKDSCNAKCDLTNGGCAYPSTCDTSKCSCVCGDSDNGRIYNVKGTTSLGTESYTDSCAGNTLTEYYCEFNQVKSESYVCPEGYGCIDGKCVPPDCTTGICCDKSTRPYKYYPAGYTCDAAKVCNGALLCDHTACDSAGNCNQPTACVACAGKTTGECGIATGNCLSLAGDDKCEFISNPNACGCNYQCSAGFVCQQMTSNPSNCEYSYSDCIAIATNPKPGQLPNNPSQCICHAYCRQC